MYTRAPKWSGQFLPWGTGGEFVNPPARIGGKMIGLGADPGAFSTQCGGGLDALNSNCWGNIWPFNYFVTPTPKVVAPPGAPSTALSDPSASIDQAQRDAILNQQLLDQQALNAGSVQSSVTDTVLGATSQVSDVVSSAASQAFSWLPWVVGGVALFGLMALGGGGPRRYGR